MVKHLIFFICLFTSVFSNIVTINSYSDNEFTTRLAQLSNNDVYLSDIDDTLILSNLPLATSSFFNYKYKQNKNKAVNIFNIVLNLI